MTSKNQMSRVAFQVAIPLFVAVLFVPMTASAQTEGTLFVQGNAVGIGTPNPTADLEILDSDFAAMRLNNTDSSTIWTFSATGAGDFTVNKIGIGPSRPPVPVISPSTRSAAEDRSSASTRGTTALGFPP
jgi:hypothetical protein